MMRHSHFPFSTLFRLSITGLALLFCSAQASPFNYNYADVHVIKPDSSTLDNGFGLNASYEVMPNYNITGSIGRVSGNNTAYDQDIDQYSIGVGYHQNLNKATDFTSSLYVLHSKNDSTVKVNNNFKRKTSNTGGGVQVGLRRVLSNDTDGTLDVGVRHLDGIDDGYAIIGVEYHMSEALSVGARYQFDNDINSGSALIRYEF